MKLRDLLFVGFLLFSTPVLASESVWCGGTSNALNSGSTEYNTVQGGGNWRTTEDADEIMVLPAAGNISDLRVVLSAAPDTGKSYTFTLRSDGGDTSLSAAIEDLETSNQDTGSYAASAGELLSIKCVPAGTPDVVSAWWSFKFDGTTAKQSVFLGNSGNNDIAANEFLAPMGSSDGDSTETDRQNVMPAAGTIKNLYVDFEQAPGAGETRTLTLTKNTAAQSLTVTVAEGNDSGNDTGNSFAVVAGDLISIQNTNSGSATASRLHWGFVFEATTDGQFCIESNSDDLPAQGSTEHGFVASGDFTWQATEANVNQLANAFTAKTIYVRTADPSAGDTHTLTVNQNAGATALSVTITAGNTTGNDSDDVTINDDDLLTWDYTPFSNPDFTKNTMGLMGFITPAAAISRGTENAIFTNAITTNTGGT